MKTVTSSNWDNTRNPTPYRGNNTARSLLRRLRQPQHAVGQRPELRWPQSHRDQAALLGAEAQHSLTGRAVATDGDDAGYVDQEARLPWDCCFRVATVFTPDSCLRPN